MIFSRRQLLTAASSAGAASILPRQARAAAEFEFKLGVNTPDTHPLTLRLAEAARAIGAQSAGRLNVTVFSNSQLGGDPEMLSQLRFYAQGQKTYGADAWARLEQYTGR